MNVRPQSVLRLVLAFSLAVTGLILLAPPEASAQTCRPPEMYRFYPSALYAYTGCRAYGYGYAYVRGTYPIDVTMTVNAPPAPGNYVINGTKSTRTYRYYAYLGGYPYMYLYRQSCGGRAINFSATITLRNQCGTRTYQRNIPVYDYYPPRMPYASMSCDNIIPPTPVGSHYYNTPYDYCDPNPSATFINEQLYRKYCEGREYRYRYYEMSDCNGNVARPPSYYSRQYVYIYDNQAPTITIPGDVSECTWPPNHELVSFSVDDFPFSAVDNCSPPSMITTWASGCSSSEPDERLQQGEIVGGCSGDGNFPNDCQMGEGGSLLVRSERCGDGEGRTYDIEGRARDDCGNTTPPTTIGVVDVPHDQDQAHVWEVECISAETGVK